MFNKKKQEVTVQLPDEIFLEITKKRRKQHILSVIVIVLLILSLFGTGIGMSHLIKMDTGLAYLGFSLLVTPLVLIVAGLLFILLKKGTNRENIVKFIGVNILLSAFIGVCIGVLYFVKLGTLLAYITSAILTCIVLYVIFNAIKEKIK